VQHGFAKNITELQPKDHNLFVAILSQTKMLRGESTKIILKAIKYYSSKFLTVSKKSKKM